MQFGPNSTIYLFTYFFYLFISLFIFSFIYLFTFLFIFLFIYLFGKTILQMYIDVIQPLAIELYMITCLLHAYDTHAKTGQNQLKLIWKSTISTVRAQNQLFEHNINVNWFACDTPSTNQRTGIKNEK